jgi:class 3 adenylate cyclase
MSLNSPTKQSIETDFSVVPELFRQNPVQNIAVLFTDVVDSTQYFKVHGDTAGREMLRVHQELASSLVTEHGGHVIKILGDSVMAYFTSGSEALKAAVRIQQKFESYNRDTRIGNHIRVRIGIHFGGVIVEEKDIYGDVVNVAAKITNLAKGNQIMVSESVHETSKGLASVHFELANLWQRNSVLGDLKVYKVHWDSTSSFEAASHIVLRIRPLFNLAPDSFRTLWATSIEMRGFLSPTPERAMRVLSDKSVLLSSSNVRSLVGAAESLLSHVKEGLGRSGHITLLPLQMFMDKVAGKGDAGSDEAGASHSWGNVMPGEIYVSEEVKDLLDGKGGFTFTTDLAEAGGRGLIRIVRVRPETPKLGGSFLYQAALVQGNGAECFYCGSRRHRAADCPSKGVPDLTRSLHRLGYFSQNRLNDLFLHFITMAETGGHKMAAASETGDAYSWGLAAEAFYELKRVFQLRFLRTMWNVTNEEWDAVHEAQGRNEGGLTWLAQDSLRVSDQTRAASLLKEAAAKVPGDYRVHVILGFLAVEGQDMEAAGRHFGDALALTGTVAQKIFLLLLRVRLCLLTARTTLADKAVREILAHSPLCIEARYFDILFRLREGKTAQALQLLTKLIREHKSYYIAAMIDPDTEPFKEIIGDKLKELLQAAREEADAREGEARNEFERSKGLLLEEETSEISSLQGTIQGLRDSESYFGYLDITNCAHLILTICRDSMKQRRKVLAMRLKEVLAGIDRTLDFMTRYRFKRLTVSDKREIQAARETIADALDSVSNVNLEQYRMLIEMGDEFSQFVKRMDGRCERLETIEQVVAGVGSFLKHAALLLAIVFLIGLVLLPLGAYYLNMCFSDSEFFAATSMWLYQKSFMILGGIAGLFVSVVMALKNLMRSR